MKCADNKQCFPSSKACQISLFCKDMSYFGKPTGDAACKDWVCPLTQWKCDNNRQCIGSPYVCDGISILENELSANVCLDGSDEWNCEQWTCVDGYQKCADNLQCIPSEQKCDGFIQCIDGSDEENCERFTCPQGQWKCIGTKQCIQSRQVCDFSVECINESDEKGKILYTLCRM